MQQRSLATGLSHHGSGVMAANIVKSTQNAVITANYDDRFSCDGSGDELAGLMHLIGARDQLPGFAEYAEAHQVGEARVKVPSCRNRRPSRPRGTVIVTGKNLLDR